MTTSPVPVVSVVIPTYNTPDAWLSECLTSVVQQTMADWEAIVVDDASTQGDAAGVVASFRDPRIHLIRHEQNRGEGASRNTAIRASRSELTFALDADDRAHPESVAACYQALQEHPEADWVITDRQLFGDAHDTLLWPVPLPPPCPAHFNLGTPGLRRRRVWEVVGGFSEEPVFRSGGVDLDFWLSAVEHGVKVIHVARPLYLYRSHGQSASQGSYAYNNHVIHETLYHRHRALFDTFEGDCPRCRNTKRVPTYLSQAYVTAARASLARGERLRALRLAIRGLTINPGDRTVQKQLLRSLLPRYA